MEKKYTLILTEKQAVLIKEALEEYFRIRMNQWEDLADSLAMKNIVLSPGNPNNERIFMDICKIEILFVKFLNVPDGFFGKGRETISQKSS